MAMYQKDFNKRFGAWVGWANGKWLDLDGFPPAQPYQCHDVLLSLLRTVFGLETWHGHAPGEGWTSEVWLQFPHYRPELAKHFTKRWGAAGIKNGSVLFWRFGDPVYPYSHIAVALQPPTPDGYVLCITQNPGNTHIENLPLSQILGYLEPIIIPEPPEKTWKKEHSMYYAPKAGARQQIKGDGEWTMVRLNAKNHTTFTNKIGLQHLDTQLNVVGVEDQEVEFAIAAYDTTESGSKIIRRKFICSTTESLSSGGSKIVLNWTYNVKKLLTGDQRLRLVVRTKGKPVTITQVRAESSRLA